MLNLVERLQSLVATAEATGGAKPPNLRPFVMDVLDTAGQHLESPPQTESWHRRRKGQLALVYREWIELGRLSRVVEQAWERVVGLWPRLEATTLGRYVEAISESLLWSDLDAFDAQPAARPPLDASRRIVLEEIIRALRWRAADGGLFAAATDHRRYAHDLGLLARDRVTAAGRVLLQLQGRDAVRWLIANELARAYGRTDMLRCTRAVALEILGRSTPVWEAGEEHPPFAWQHVERFADLGLVDVLDEDEAPPDMYGYVVTAFGRDVQAELKTRPLPPVWELAATLAADATADALRLQDAAGTRAAAATVEGATVRLTRLLAHELRNKLQPLQTALGILAAPTPDAGHRERALQLADGAVASLFELVASFEQMATGLRQPYEWFDLGAALLDAIAAGRNGDPRASIELDDAIDGFQMRGPRPRTVLALANLVRNSVQHARGDARVAITLEEAGDSVRLLVDDAGPGVAPELRRRIFEPGFSSRSGGSGTGLHLVQQLFERELGGTVLAEESPLGGTRIAIRLASSVIRPRSPRRGAPE